MNSPISDLILVNLDAPCHAKLPMHRRIFEIVRRAILDRSIQAGTKMPSTRSLSVEFGCARNTILQAFEQLRAEGFIEAHTGSGSYVADTRPSHGNTATRRKVHTPRELSARGKRLTQFPSRQHFEIEGLVPEVDGFFQFPHKLWQKLQTRHWRAPDQSFLDYSRTGGHTGLREALADHLRLARSVRIDPEQILITAGTQQSLDLCSRLLCDAGDPIWMENPGFWGAHRIFSANEFKIRPIAVDDEGINPSEADLATRPRMIYVTPSHQYPTDVVMSLARRRLLVDFASRHGAWILEDDYDAEFRYNGKPLASLQGLDDQNRVLYLGTFSKVLYPGIRIGYIAVPEDLLEGFRIGLSDVQRPGQIAVQAALADFIREGHFASHIRNLRNRYGQSRAILQYTLQKFLDPAARLSQADTGLHMVIHLPDDCDDVEIAVAAGRKKLAVKPLSGYYFAPPASRGLVVGYGYTPLEALAPAAKILANLVNGSIGKSGKILADPVPRESWAACD
ncbi:PLP-dependent aminotransferase family protein [Ramlibacter monticola]|uniref:PLP-dependent aminotransferase family protein n=1 Tax=Ramlibacter monticola TaxID=1926872 RepID=A0A937CUY5_9BURK|nr:PLP-dependent aminotransferase family protein [Ramlibacter monticola]MBL0393243.1 PLP-dependent aminotransferase family protein [Ramlibacter monticola]